MKYEHSELASGRWARMPLAEQMANIGSEVERALNWQAKSNAEYTKKAFERALELLDLTMASVTNYAHIREVARLREAIADYFFGSNECNSTGASWRKYFMPFYYSVRAHPITY